MEKIIFGITGLTLGGAERVLVDVANRLVNKYEITIFTIYANGELEDELDKKIHLKSLYNFSYSSLKGIKKKIIPLKVLIGKSLAIFVFLLILCYSRMKFLPARFYKSAIKWRLLTSRYIII